MRAAAARLEAFPAILEIGSSNRPLQMSTAVIEMLQCAGYISRVYVNQLTGENVRVALLLGPPGPIAVHTPEICFSAQDYRQEESRKRVAIGSNKDARMRSGL